MVSPRVLSFLLGESKGSQGLSPGSLRLASTITMWAEDQRAREGIRLSQSGRTSRSKPVSLRLQVFLACLEEPCLPRRRIAVGDQVWLGVLPILLVNGTMTSTPQLVRLDETS